MNWYFTEDQFFLLELKMPPAKIILCEELNNDLNKLRRIGLEEDFEVFKQVVSVEPNRLSGIVRLSGIGEEFYPVYKARKFRCRALNRGCNSGIRVIYTYNPSTNEVSIIEIYYKGDRENNDMSRARKYAVRK